MARPKTEPGLMGVAEIAARVGVTPGLVSQWNRRGLLPAPVARLARATVWAAADIERWAVAREAASDVS